MSQITVPNEILLALKISEAEAGKMLRMAAGRAVRETKAHGTSTLSPADHPPLFVRAKSRVGRPAGRAPQAWYCPCILISQFTPTDALLRPIGLARLCNRFAALVYR
jgi:hypothetical protein